MLKLGMVGSFRRLRGASDPKTGAFHIFPAHPVCAYRHLMDLFAYSRDKLRHVHAAGGLSRRMVALAGGGRGDADAGEILLPNSAPRAELLKRLSVGVRQ